MEKDNKYYLESLNHDTNWLNMSIIEIDKFLIDCYYINLFMQMYFQCINEDGYTSSSLTLSIPRPPCFEKLAL